MREEVALKINLPESRVQVRSARHIYTYTCDLALSCSCKWGKTHVKLLRKLAAKSSLFRAEKQLNFAAVFTVQKAKQLLVFSQANIAHACISVYVLAAYLRPSSSICLSV